RVLEMSDTCGAHWSGVHPLPVLFRPIAFDSSGLFFWSIQIEHGVLAVIVKKPCVHKKPLRGDREIVTTFALSDARSFVVGKIVAAYLPTKMLRDQVCTARACSRLMGAAGKSILITRETIQLFAKVIPTRGIRDFGHEWS